MASIYCRAPSWFKGERVGGWVQPQINIETNQTHFCCVNVNDTGHDLFLLARVPKFRNAGPKMNAV